MFALFLESLAAKQIDVYCAANRQDPLLNAEELKKSLYASCFHCLYGKLWKALEGITPEEAFDHWWIDRCLDKNRHKNETVDTVAIWDKTPEGHAFWSAIHRFRE